jgi:hypothetical protein
MDRRGNGIFIGARSNSNPRPVQARRDSPLGFAVTDGMSPLMETDVAEAYRLGLGGTPLQSESEPMEVTESSDSSLAVLDREVF